MRTQPVSPARLISQWLPSSDSARVRRLVDVLAAANAGDLTARTGSTADDDLGEVERALDQLLERTVAVVGTVQQGVDRLHDARMSVAGLHKEMLDTAEENAGRAYDAGVSAEQVSDSVFVVASSTEELAITVNEIARHANHAAEVAAQAAAQGEIADRGVHELTSAMQQVEGIADVISGIAEQTHLLALNAMIEAARAGDAGLGFSVVASEVKELSRATADATEQVRSIVAGITEGSARASEAIRQIGTTLDQISANTASIASTITQQTATTGEIGRVSSIAAHGASDISGQVTAVHDAARNVAYLGARNDANKAKEFQALERAFRAVTEGLRVGDFTADIDETIVAVDQAELNDKGTTTDNGVTTVMDYVEGTGLNEFQYTGSWLHGLGYDTDPCGDAYSNVAGDSVTLRFRGRRIRFYGFQDQQQGMADVWVDGAEPDLVDIYAPVRGRAMLWESPELPAGEHTFHLRVSPKKNAQSRYFWCSVAMVEIVH